jgi:hypothetical protein
MKRKFTNHTSSLAVANVWIEPGHTTQYSSQAWHTSARDVTETCIAWHRPQEVLSTKKLK